MLGCLHIETQGKVCVCAQGTVSCVTERLRELLNEIPMCAGIAR